MPEPVMDVTVGMAVAFDTSFEIPGTAEAGVGCFIK